MAAIAEVDQMTPTDLISPPTFGKITEIEPQKSSYSQNTEMLLQPLERAPSGDTDPLDYKTEETDQSNGGISEHFSEESTKDPLHAEMLEESDTTNKVSHEEGCAILSEHQIQPK